MSAVTLEWLRDLVRRGNSALADDMAHALVHSTRLYTIEEYEHTLSQVVDRYPWMHIESLCPWPWIPVFPCGKLKADITQLTFTCSLADALASGLLTADMLPQGRKRTARSELDSGVKKIAVETLYGDLRVTANISDDLRESDPWSLFRSSAIRRRGGHVRPRLILLTPPPEVRP